MNTDFGLNRNYRTEASMYINNLGMRDEQNIGSVSANRTDAAVTRTGSTAAADKTGQSAKTDLADRTSEAGLTKFPTTLQQAIESQNVLSSASAAKIEEALDRLKSNAEWEDVGTTLEALYKNQQTMQAQMNLLSAGYSGSYAGLTGLSAGTLYGNQSALSSLYNGTLTSGLLGTSIFGDMLL